MAQDIHRHSANPENCLAAGPQGRAWLARSLAVLLAAVATLAGCESAYNRDATLGPPIRRPTVSLVRPTTQPATSRPDCEEALADLVRAGELITQLDYLGGRILLTNLEGRFLLARDLEHAPEALFWLAFCNEKLGMIEQACVEYERLIDRYPQARQARTALDRLNTLRPVLARPAVRPQ